MSGATDSGMVKTMGVVMACLAVFAVVCVLAARMLGIGSDDSNDPLMRNALIQRIQPIAAVRTSADELAAPAETVTAMADGASGKSGEELVNGACAACHLAGVAGAPALDDEAAWAQRREAGLDALVSSVINGKGAMPARGGSAYSDDEIRTATQYIAGFEVDDAAAAPAAEPAATDTAEAAPEADSAEAEESAEAASDAETSDAASVESAEAETADAETSDAASVESTEAETGDAETSDAASVESTEAEASDAAAVDEPTEVAATEGAAGGEAVAALVVGEVPEGLTDNIKANVDGVCAGCHLAGVAGAPKNGDKVAWQERADKGLAALTASVINGLNVMPPRGGSALTDEEIPIAIQYLMSK